LPLPSLLFRSIEMHQELELLLIELDNLKTASNMHKALKKY